MVRSIAALLLAAYALSVPPEPRFALASEKTLPPIVTSDNGDSYSVLSVNGKSVLTVKAGRLTVHALDSVVSKELLPEGSIPTGPSGYWIAWSPDERYVYYPQVDQTLPDLWRVDLKKHVKECVVKNVALAVYGLQIGSPDGQKIAFRRGRAMMFADADGHNERPWCEKCNFVADSMAWSPDSSRIFFTTWPRADQSHSRGPSISSFVLDVATGDVKDLGTWPGVIRSVVWPAWDQSEDDGVFLCLRKPNTAADLNWFNMMVHGETRVLSPIWHLNIATGERTELTQPSGNYQRLFGAGPNRFSLIASRAAPPVSQWDKMTHDVFGADLPSRAATAVILTLKK